MTRQCYRAGPKPSDAAVWQSEGDTAGVQSYRSERAIPVAMYASSIAMQSLKSRKTKME